MNALSDNSADGPPDHVALSAVVAALDRAGLTVKSSATFEIAAKPFELVFDSIVSGSREKATSRRDAAEHLGLTSPRGRAYSSA